MRFCIGILIALVVLAADQASKYAVLHIWHLQDGHVLSPLPVLDLVLVWNHGITFGLFAGFGAKILLAVLASLVIIALLVWMARTKSWLVTVAASAIAGGAVGNVLDRLRYGAVVDFIHVHIGAVAYPWVFNVGDSAIVCGVIALMIENLFRKPRVAADEREG
ncbi:MAG: signal peptidase II [Proteobacteria bacterium]|nr:signal peptidase II [Pseudomonadota bacterium]MBU6425218.1 signal peptidase II [Rhodospirillales bacterium]